MRFPKSRIYRAFRELDGFADEDCQRWVSAVRSRRWLSICAAFIPAGFLGFLGGLTVSAGVVAALLWLPPRYVDWLEHYPRLVDLLAVSLVILPVLTGCMLLLAVRDIVLRRAIRKLILSAGCPGCGFSLLGLVATEDKGSEHVICPECGSRFSLTSLGFTREQLLCGVGHRAENRDDTEKLNSERDRDIESAEGQV